MKRLFDLVLGITSLIVLAAPMLAIALLVKLTSSGPVLYWSSRVGQGNKNFMMPKFRTMRVKTPQVATHLLLDPEQYLTPLGHLLRISSLDELPQLYNILKGELSFVGPRPALFNQSDLVALRTEKGIHHLLPGLTGWAQINGRDELPIFLKVNFDEHYLKHRSLFFDVKIIFMTFFKVLRAEGIKH